MSACAVLHFIIIVVAKHDIGTLESGGQGRIEFVVELQVNLCAEVIFFFFKSAAYCLLLSIIGSTEIYVSRELVVDLEISAEDTSHEAVVTVVDGSDQRIDRNPC